MAQKKRPPDDQTRATPERPFHIKAWLDANVVPLLAPDLKLYSFFLHHSASIPARLPSEILVILLVDPPPGSIEHAVQQHTDGGNGSSEVDRAPEHGPELRSGSESVQASAEPEIPHPSPASSGQVLGWSGHVKRLLETENFRFDHLRDVQLAPVPGGHVPLFGGDGTPIYGPNGMVSVRLYRKQADGCGLILQPGCRYKPLQATAAIKQFFASFNLPPFEVIERFKAVWGQA